MGHACLGETLCPRVFEPLFFFFLPISSRDVLFFVTCDISWARAGTPALTQCENPLSHPHQHQHQHTVRRFSFFLRCAVGGWSEHFIADGAHVPSVRIQWWKTRQAGRGKSETKKNQVYVIRCSQQKRYPWRENKRKNSRIMSYCCCTLCVNPSKHVSFNAVNKKGIPHEKRKQKTPVRYDVVPCAWWTAGPVCSCPPASCPASVAEAPA